MSFSDFKNIAEVQALYKIKYEEGIFLSGAEQMPSVGFLEDFEFSKENIDIFTSESSRSAAILNFNIIQ